MLALFERATLNAKFLANEEAAADATRLLAHIAYEEALFGDSLRATTTIACVSRLIVMLDVSMMIAWLFDDERTDAAHEIMMRVVTDGA